MAITTQTLRLTLDSEMQDALKVAEQDFPGLKPTQIIRTVFLKSFQTKNTKVPSIEELLQEFDNVQENPNMPSDEEFGEWWAKTKKEMRGKASD